MARFKKGESGNPAGKPKGTTDWRSKLRKQIEEAAPGLIDKLVAQAEWGDVAAIKLLLDKVLPNVKPQSLPVNIDIPTGDESASILAVFSAMSKGEISPDAGNELVHALATLSKVRETSEIIQRIEQLEKLLQRGLNRDCEPCERSSHQDSRAD